MARERIAVTGGSGFLGTHLMKALIERGDRVLNVDLAPNPYVAVETRICDLTRDEFGWVEEFRPDVVFHLAGLSNERLCSDRGRAFDVNVRATFRLLDWLTRISLRRFVFMSTIAVYEETPTGVVSESTPLSVHTGMYPFTKALAESICDHFRETKEVPILTYRLSNIYGPHQAWEGAANLIPQIFGQAIREGKIEVWNRRPVRDWIYAEDAAKALAAGLETDWRGVVNLGTGKGTAVGDLVDLVAQMAGVEAVTLDRPVSGLGRAVCDTTNLESVLGYVPSTPVEEGLERTYAYYREAICR